jgi:dCMP deaminase
VTSEQNWDIHFLALAEAVAQKSKDPSRQVGCVIYGPDKEIRSTGFNGFGRGIDEDKPERWVRPEKYRWVVHSERNSIYNAARIGVSTKGCTMVIQSPPCSECAKAIIQAGITTIVTPDEHQFEGDKAWEEDFLFARTLLRESGVKTRRMWSDKTNL